jgi:hypothetical protein
MATYADMEELIRLGAYRPGSSAEVDEAIRLHRPLENFLAQAREEATGITEGYRQLADINGADGNRKLTLSTYVRLNRGSRASRHNVPPCFAKMGGNRRRLPWAVVAGQE